MKYVKKCTWLPYGQKMIQVFALESNIIKKAICYNEFLQKSFIIQNTYNLIFIMSNNTEESKEDEFTKFESYL